MTESFYLVRGLAPDKTGRTIKLLSGDPLTFSMLDAAVSGDGDYASLSRGDSHLLDPREAVARGMAGEATQLSVLANSNKLVTDSINASNQSVATLLANNNFTGIFESLDGFAGVLVDRKSTRLNSSHRL